MTFDFDERFALFDMTPVDNQFIRDYLPQAKGDAVRVYLYGLMRCYHPEEGMDEERMSHDLGMTAEEIRASFRYWERRGLVRRISDEPPAYRFISPKQREGGAEALDPEYEAFAESLYGVFSNERRLHGSEIQTCYEWVTELKLPPEAVIMLLRHMQSVKGKNFSIRSAEQVAVQMAEANIRTIEEAEAFLSRDLSEYEGTKAVLKRLGKRNLPSEDQVALYRKWTREWGFTREAIEEACAETAKGDPSMGFLDGVLRNLKENAEEGPIGEENVLAARKEREALRSLLRTMGGGAVSEPTMQWYRRISREYPEEVIQLAARECGRSGGSPEKVERMLKSWKEKGISTLPEAERYVQEFRSQSELMMKLRKLWGIGGRMGEKDRAMIARWEKEMGFSRDMILFAAEAAAGTERPMAYLNRILEEYAKEGIRTREAAERDRQKRAARKPSETRPAKAVSAQQYEQRDYSTPSETLEEMLTRLNGGVTPDA